MAHRYTHTYEKEFTAVAIKTLENGVGYKHKLRLALRGIDTNCQTS